VAVTAHQLPEWLEEALSVLGDDGPESPSRRLSQQLGFLLELDKAKQVYRRTYVTDGSRRENDAEHMWHATLAALLLAEHASEEVDPGRLAKMLAIHDIVEIDAGDAFIYDQKAALEKEAREKKAAERLFGLLPADQREDLTALWQEFEERQSPTARMAAAIDRLLPLLMNRAVEGRTWTEAGITADRVLSVNAHIENGSPRLWQVARHMLETAVRDGVLQEPA
jgi:putative hydrolase of HD superfamily